MQLDVVKAIAESSAVSLVFFRKTKWYGYADHVGCIRVNFGQSTQGSKLRGAEGQNAPKLIPNAPRLLNLGAKFCYPIQPDICFEA